MRDAQRRDGMRDDGRQAFTLNAPYKPAIELQRVRKFQRRHTWAIHARTQLRRRKRTAELKIALAVQMLEVEKLVLCGSNDLEAGRSFAGKLRV
jgi:hypothetical protein